VSEPSATIGFHRHQNGASKYGKSLKCFPMVSDSGR
jgi:hypothetical protein